MSAWCILRTSGQQTLRLEQSLAEDGFEVWTPRECRSIKVRRANVRREITQPIMPGFVFAKAEHLVDLLQLSKMEVRPRRGTGWGRPAHARFSVMRHGDAIPIVEERHLSSLRQIEGKAALARIRLKKTEPLPVGVSVRVKDGFHLAWLGMIGKVTKSTGKVTSVSFSNAALDVEIRTSILSLDEVGQDRP